MPNFWETTIFQKKKYSDALNMSSLKLHWRGFCFFMDLHLCVCFSLKCCIFIILCVHICHNTFAEVGAQLLESQLSLPRVVSLVQQALFPAESSHVPSKLTEHE